MKLLLIVTLFFSSLLAASAAEKLVPTQDAPGFKDYPGLPRYEGSALILQSSKKFGELGLQIGGLSAPDSADPKEVRKVEGALHRSTYLLPNVAAGKRTSQEVAENYTAALKDAGFTPIWSGEDRDIRNGPPRRYYAVPELGHQVFTTGVKERRYQCLEKGGLYIAVYVATRSWEIPVKEDISPWKKELTLPQDSIVIQVDVVNTKPMEDKMIHISAAEMQKSISASGKVAIYGILFDFNEAVIKPESAPTLREMASLLKAEPSLKVLVVGHTDNVGAFEFNEDLSKRRAKAVVEALASKHGIEAARMTPLGASFMAPVSTNATDAGRALNRRVELVAR